jgi:hypothetical protein
MSVLCRHVGLAIAALVLLVATSGASSAEEISVPPPNSTEANNATHNIQDVIDAIREKGYRREAGQLQKLLDDGRVFYRTKGKFKNIGQFVHGVGEPDKLYFGAVNVKYNGTGALRFNENDGLLMVFTVQRALHEMVHKDQGRASIVDSNKRKSERGYELHEIEAYRVALKKFSQKWIIDESNDYLKKQAPRRFKWVA